MTVTSKFQSRTCRTDSAYAECAVGPLISNMTRQHAESAESASGEQFGPAQDKVVSAEDGDLIRGLVAMFNFIYALKVMMIKRKTWLGVSAIAMMTDVFGHHLQWWNACTLM